MAKEIAIVLSNGSINSAVVTALAAQKFRPVLLHVETSARPGSRARAAYDQQVGHFKPYREHTLAMPWASSVSAPAQNAAGIADPRTDIPLAERLLDLLPLIAAAARFAVQYRSNQIYLGMRVGPNADALAQGTEYFQIWNELLQLPLNESEMELQTPLLELEPWQVVDVGVQVAAPFDKTWTCMSESTEPCWACRGCRAREAAFQQAGKPDPMRVIRKV